MAENGSVWWAFQGMDGGTGLRAAPGVAGAFGEMCGATSFPPGTVSTVKVNHTGAALALPTWQALRAVPAERVEDYCTRTDPGLWHLTVWNGTEPHVVRRLTCLEDLPPEDVPFVQAVQAIQAVAR